jgi:hypothetical protein
LNDPGKAELTLRNTDKAGVTHACEPGATQHPKNLTPNQLIKSYRFLNVNMGLCGQVLNCHFDQRPKAGAAGGVSTADG